MPNVDVSYLLERWSITDKKIYGEKKTRLVMHVERHHIAKPSQLEIWEGFRLCLGERNNNIHIISQQIVHNLVAL